MAQQAHQTTPQINLNSAADPPAPAMNDSDQLPDVPESPKPLAFTVDFGDGKKSIDTQRHQALVEKFQRKHRRGQSLSKLDDAPTIATPNKKHPLTGNLPRKSSFQSDGYFSSDEKSDRAKSARAALNTKRSELSLPLRNVTGDKMTQSCPNGGDLFDETPDCTPEVELKNVSSPELDPITPYSPPFIDGTEFDFDRSDTVSDAGTYTLDADNYSEEQKARMSIDAEFKIEQISVSTKTEEYVRSLPVHEPERKEPTKPAYKVRLSPILSPTQNLSITESPNEEALKTFTRIMFPSAKSRENGLEQFSDQGSVISVTSSGAFKAKTEQEAPPKVTRCSLVKSEVHVETYFDSNPVKKLTANLVNVQSISIRRDEDSDVLSSKLLIGKVSNLPPAIGGKVSPTKIPSPVHVVTRPRSRNGTFDLSDSSLETESYLKPTQNCINALQQRLAQEGDNGDRTWGLQLNNSPASLLKLRGAHTRHNSLDDKSMKISNKLEHFKAKDLHQGIDQTTKMRNSPTGSPLRRSSSFSTKKPQFVKNTNLQKENSTIQRSASTANIKPTYLNTRRSSDAGSNHAKIDRTLYGDTTESSSEEEYDKGQTRKRDLANIMNARYNRAFSLRRARLDEPVVAQNRCPNTPEMRRKFQPDHARAISMDRKPPRTVEVQSRYLQSVAKKPVPVVVPPVGKVDFAKNGARNNAGSAVAKVPAVGKGQVFARTDSGRFSMRTKPATTVGGPKSTKKEGGGKKSNGRSNSSLSSREKEFQNWKRRKSYDPMKAAAEGKRVKEMAKRQPNVMTQSCQEASPNQDCDSSPSRSSSVHRSQSFHGTAALEHLGSSEEDDDDFTLSADEGFSPPTPSPCELSPARASLRNAWRDHVLH